MLCVAILLPGIAAAQFQLILDLPDVKDYPLVHIPLQVLDNSASISVLDTSNFSVRENGVLQYPLFLDCTQMVVPDSINFIFVLDHSLSMGFIEGTRKYDPDSVKWRRAKKVFIDAFKKLRMSDRGAFLSFCEEVNMQQYFTSDTTLLIKAISGLALCAGTSIYDALMYALQIGEAQPGKTVIIILTDGSDQTSRYDSSAVVAKGRAAHIPIYSIGLGVEPADVAVFRYLSLNTGGEYFIAPTSQQLADVFDRIMKSIFSSRCLLSYVPLDSCQRGSRRDVEVEVRYNGSSTSGDTYYHVPDLRSRTRVTVAPDVVEDDQQVLLPVMLAGELRVNEPLDFECIVRFDPLFFAWSGVETAGGILANQNLNVQQLAAGQYLVQGDAVLASRGIPYGESDVLFTLRMDVLHREKNERTTISVSAVNFRQHCDMLSQGDSATITVLGCPSKLRIEIDSLLIVPSGRAFMIPIHLRHAIDVQQPCQYSFTVRYDTSLIRYTGFSTALTISADLTVTVVESIPGSLFISAEPGLPAFTTGEILYLDFMASRQRSAKQVSLSIDQVSFVQSCTPVIQYSSGSLFIDGDCEPMLYGTRSVAVGKIAPQPVSRSRSNSVQLTLHVPMDGPVSLDLTDINGRPVQAQENRFMTAGTHLVQFPLDAVPPGSYIITFRQGDDSNSKTMIITR